MILVDGSNLYKSMKRCGLNIWPPELPGMLLPHVRGGVDPVCKVHYFTSVDRKNASQQRFINHISNAGLIVYAFDLRSYERKNVCPACDLECQSCGRYLRIRLHWVKMIDIALCTKLIELAYQKEPEPYDTFIVVSGDKDIVPAIRLVRNTLGKEVIVAGFRSKDPAKNSLAYELNREVDGIINLLETRG